MALNVPARSSGLAATVIPFVVLVVGLFAAIAVYTPGLSGPFFFDDIFNIQNNPNLRLAQLDPDALRLAAFSTDSGPFRRPISMVSFALNFHFFGEGAASFKAVNLGIHLLNGVLIFLLSRLLLRHAARRADLRLRGDRAGLAAGLIAAVWLVHPLNLTGVLYAVQRMTSLSALFVLLALLAYLQGRLRLPDRRLQGAALLAASALFWLCGLASKENALLLPWYIFLIEWLFLYPLQPRQPPAPGVRLYPFAWLLVPLVGGLVYLALHPAMLSYDFRPFTLWERLLTEARALWFYLGLIVLPRPAAFGIFHDDFALSTGLFVPWTTLPAVVGLLLASGLAIRFARRFPLPAFGFLFFLAAHALESSIFPLEIMHEHRNYLAAFGILFGGVATLVLTDSPNWNFQPKMRVSVVAVFFVFFGAITLGRAIQWQDLSRLILSQVAHHPESASSNYEAGRLYVNLREQTADWLQRDEFNAGAVRHFSRTAALSPRDTSGLLAVLLANAGNATTTDPSVVRETLNRLRDGILTDAAIGNLLALSWCERQRECSSLPEGQVDALFQALLANPQMGGELWATVFDEMALRAMSAAKFAEAEALFKQVLAINATKAMYRLNYAALLVRLDRLDEARDHIAQVLAAPQPATVVQVADDLKHRIEQGHLPVQAPDQASPAPTGSPGFSLEDLMKPRDDKIFDFRRDRD